MRLPNPGGKRLRLPNAGGKRLRERIIAAGPSPTIRLRLTLTYGLVFLITGAVLLTIGYELVRHNISDRGHFRDELQKLGLPPPPKTGGFFGHPFLFAPGSAAARIAEAVRAQLLSDSLHRLLLEYVLALGAMTMISVGAGWLLAGRALRPLRDITATARRVSGENLGERIALSGPADELKELADTFDGMLSRLDSAFASQRHFVANASHELRTPLAIMRTEVDVALADPDAGIGDLRAMGDAVRETIDRSERLIESLLVLARSQAAAGPEEVVDLAALAGDCITDFTPRAEDADLSVHAALGPALTRGHTGLLERMIANLIDNGIQHNEPGGTLEVSTWTDGADVHLFVSNGGAVIDPEQARVLTEPFRRLHRSSAGFGLGLSIVQSVVSAHHGQLVLTAAPEGGLAVEITLGAARSEPDVVVPRTPGALTKS